jgi:hypothetical protein
MAWHLDGTYIENCSCDVPCPCTVSLDRGADRDRCNALLVFHIDDGEIDGTDVGGLTIAAVASTPKVMAEGNWRLGVVVDSAASDEQAGKLGAVFGGQLGGPMEALGPFIGEDLGVERQAIEVVEDGLSHRVRIGDSIDVLVEDIVPFGVEDGTPVKLTDVFHPAGSTLTIAKATSSKISAFGMDFDNEGRSGFSARFSWSA